MNERLKSPLIGDPEHPTISRVHDVAKHGFTADIFIQANPVTEKSGAMQLSQSLIFPCLSLQRGQTGPVAKETFMVGFRSFASAATVAAAVSAVSMPAMAEQNFGLGFSASSPVAVVVKVPTPWYAPRFLVTSKMRDTIPQYQAIAGLNFKAFSFAKADGHFGGIMERQYSIYSKKRQTGRARFLPRVRLLNLGRRPHSFNPCHARSQGWFHGKPVLYPCRNR